MNSKRKGSGGERELAGILRSHGYDARKNEQRYIGGLENPDVSLPGMHIECKRTEALRLYDAIEQARRDANGKTLPCVAYRKNHCPWIAIMILEDWVQLYAAWEAAECGRRRLIPWASGLMVDTVTGQHFEPQGAVEYDAATQIFYCAGQSWPRQIVTTLCVEKEEAI